MIQTVVYLKKEDGGLTMHKLAWHLFIENTGRVVTR